MLISGVKVVKISIVIVAMRIYGKVMNPDTIIKNNSIMKDVVINNGETTAIPVVPLIIQHFIDF